MEINHSAIAMMSRAYDVVGPWCIDLKGDKDIRGKIEFQCDFWIYSQDILV